MLTDRTLSKFIAGVGLIIRLSRIPTAKHRVHIVDTRPYDKKNIKEKNHA